MDTKEGPRPVPFGEWQAETKRNICARRKRVVITRCVIVNIYVCVQIGVYMCVCVCVCVLRGRRGVAAVRQRHVELWSGVGNAMRCRE